MNRAQPDYLKKAQKQFGLERLTWEGNAIPSMINEFWWRFKWVAEDDGTSWRSWINRFSVVYDNFTRQLKIEFDFDTQFWVSTHGDQGEWVYA